MSNIFKLARMDIRKLFRLPKRILIVFILILLVSLYEQFYPMAFLITTILGTYSIISSNFLHKEEYLYASLPISRKDVVSGRYTFIFLMAVILAVVLGLISTLGNITMNGESFSIYLFSIMGISFLCGMVLVSIMLPISFSMDVRQKTTKNIIVLICMGGFILASYYLPKLNDTIMYMDNNLLLYGSYIAGVIVFIASYIGSLRIYGKREFLEEAEKNDVKARR